MNNNNEQSMESRGNFASRLLSAAMSERKSVGGRVLVAPGAPGYIAEESEHHHQFTATK